MMRVLVFLLAAAFALSAQSIDVKKHVLSNGMTVLIHEDHDIPNVALYFFYKVGSRNEVPGTTGLSHFFEHMMFNGAKKYGPKQFDIQMENAGGRNNGFTTRDMTAYQDWFPRSSLELMFDLEADRIRDLAFDPKIIESERGVVYSERRLSVDNNPTGALLEQLYAAAFTAHTYHWSPIGWPADIEGWTMADLKHHWNMGYAPNNCVMVIAGDVTEAEVLALSRKYLEPIARRDPPPPVRTTEPEQKGERRLQLERPVQVPTMMAGYHVPNARHADWPALQVLSNLLTQGRASRLYQRLVEKDQLALSVNAFLQDSIDPGLWVFMLQPRAGVENAKLEAALFDELELARRDEIPAAELEAAKNRLLAGFYRQMKTISGKANLLGQFEVMHGDVGEMAKYRASIAQVTAADLQRVARAWLAPRNRTIATLVPEKKESAK